jgi:general nucleoside transport system ATP-binding protein
LTIQNNGGEQQVPLLELKQITKVFGSLKANDQIDLDVKYGEIHALLGENGAGKTTLMNILYGLYHPDGGEIMLRGEVTRINSPRDAIHQRIGMIHQHFMLVPTFSVVENVILGLPVDHEPLLDLQSAARRLSELSEQFGLKIDPFTLVGELPVGVQQRVEIIKALYRGADLLVLDEPTAVLSPLEVESFFEILRQLVNKGLSIIFISHKLDEVLRISDRITVLRRGKKVGTIPTTLATTRKLAEMMVGREVFLEMELPPRVPGLPVLEVSQLCSKAESTLQALKNISFTIHTGEVLGIAGVDGNGQQQLAEVMAGLQKTSSGSIQVQNVVLTNRPPEEYIHQGVCYVPADRQRTGLVLNFNVEENLILKHSDRPPFARSGVLQWGLIRDYGKRVIQEYDIRVPDGQTLSRNLSGGNQQKVILAREIEDGPALLILMHPTRGLDIGATEYVRQRILEQRSKGVAVLLISTEIEEVLALSDRVAVMFRGEVMGIVPGSSDQLERISHMMLGERQESSIGQEN